MPELDSRVPGRITWQYGAHNPLLKVGSQAERKSPIHVYADALHAPCRLPAQLPQGRG
jgi:hypothetical protein